MAELVVQKVCADACSQWQELMAASTQNQAFADDGIQRSAVPWWPKTPCRRISCGNHPPVAKVTGRVARAHQHGHSKR